MATGTRGKSKSAAKSRRHARLRKKVVGTEARPRLVVTRSARHVFVQVVDDSKGHTLASASTLEAGAPASRTAVMERSWPARSRHAAERTPKREQKLQAYSATQGRRAP